MDEHKRRPEGASPEERTVAAKSAVMADARFASWELTSQLASSSLSPSPTVDGSFGQSLRSFLLYAQCTSGGGRSPGLLVVRDDSKFAVGFYPRHGGVAAHIIAPQGRERHRYVAELGHLLLDQSLVDIVYLRHVPQGDTADYESYGFRELSPDAGWCAGASFEDETFNHRLVDLGAIIHGGDELAVKTLKSEGTKNFRNKFRLAFQRCRNFLKRNSLEFSLRPMTPNDRDTARALVQDHFDVLESSGRAVGSCAADYELLLANFLPDDDRYVSLLGVLRSTTKEVVVSAFLGERTSDTSGGLYCSITSRNPSSTAAFAPACDLTGFTALSQYALARVFGVLLARGWRTVDLGGSETEELDCFKRQMGAREYPDDVANAPAMTCGFVATRYSVK